MVLKKRIHEILEVEHPDDSVSRLFQSGILSLIALNVIALILDSEPTFQRATPVFAAFELLSVSIFSVEYLLRIWSCTDSAIYSHPLWGRVRFATTPLAIVDLVAVLPFYLPFVGVNMLFVRAIRLVRVFRIAKLARYSTALRTFGRVLSQKKEELIIASFLLGLSAVITSTLMYFAESDAQPQYFSSIPAAMWWIVWFMVGKGDVFPVTIIGKCVGVAIAILGVAIFALPTAILGAGFLEEMQHRHKHENICPHCGKELTK